MVIDRCNLFFIFELLPVDFKAVSLARLNDFRAKCTNYQAIFSAKYPAFLTSCCISSGEWLVSTFSTRSALSRSTAQFSTFSSLFKKGVTVATHPPHLILVLNFKVSMIVNFRASALMLMLNCFTNIGSNARLLVTELWKGITEFLFRAILQVRYLI